MAISKASLLLLAVFLLVCADALPYNPVSILTSTKFQNVVHIFRPTSDGSNFELVTIDVSTNLTPDQLSSATSISPFPFKVEDQIAFAPFIDNKGMIFMVEGDCTNGAEDAKLWTYTPKEKGMTGNWAEISLEAGSGNFAGSESIGFLSSGMAFSASTNGSSTLYTFGGMCPNATDLTIDTWQTSSAYSNSMRTIRQSTTPGASDGYVLNTLWTRGPPIPEAGFSVTALKPTYFNSSTGTAQQQNYVMLGGHTTGAFINMSQLAVFSLPQQSWAFVPIELPAVSTQTDLSKRVSAVDSRSGHTAVLSEDGTKIVVIGGWVGDVSTPADPQVAILEIGEGYGGDGSWEWRVPDINGKGLPSGAGIYGHGATMLPGDVLMITGGYSIATPGRTRMMERSEPMKKETLFLNITSNTWVSSYENLTPKSGSTSPDSSGDHASDNKVGLGVGIALGLAAILCALGAFVIYQRRAKRRRLDRENDLRELSADAHRFHAQSLGAGGIDGRGGNQTAGTWMSENNNYTDAYPWAPTLVNVGSAGPMRGTEAERTGLLVEIPSPTRGLRRSLYSRGNHYYEDGRSRNRGSGHIHRIDERDEEEEEKTTNNAEGSSQVPQDDIISSAPILDPFRDPSELHLLDGSRSPSPVSVRPISAAEEREREIRGWVTDWTAAESLMQQQAGRTSPEKSDRTSSTLSDQSVHSAVSALSFQQSIGSITRSISQRSAAILYSNVLSGQRVAPTSSITEPPTNTSPNLRRYRRSPALQPIPPQNRHSAGATLGTSFPRLQSEGQALLGSPSSPTRADSQPQSQQSPTQSRARNWMGTMRRALVGGSDRSASPPADRSTSSSPIKDADAELRPLPQRSASAGAMLWRRRQGARDWDVEDRVGRENNSLHAPNNEEEWDVESAVERRVVQVMFTVPKEKLRVVNAGGEVDGLSIASVEDTTRLRDLDEDPTGDEKGKGKVTDTV